MIHHIILYGTKASGWRERHRVVFRRVNRSVVTLVGDSAATLNGQGIDDTLSFVENLELDFLVHISIGTTNLKRIKLDTIGTFLVF